MERMSHTQVREIIATTIQDYVPLFADRWERFPDEKTSFFLIKKLQAELPFWRKHNTDHADKIENAIAEIKKRL